VCVVLVAARNPLNIGAAARAMSNFGLRHLRVVNPYQVAFREARSAVGASALLASAQEYTSVADAVADCTLVVGTTAVRHRDLQHVLRPLPEGAGILREQASAGSIALLFGSEKVGLSNRDFTHCHWLMHIPTSKDNISMNLGQAVAVCLYELVRDNNPSSTLEKATRANAEELERITGLLLEALQASGYVEARAARATDEKVRRLVRRLELQADDAEVWLGMLRQIVWKLGQAGDKEV